VSVELSDLLLTLSFAIHFALAATLVYLVATGGRSLALAARDAWRVIALAVVVFTVNFGVGVAGKWVQPGLSAEAVQLTKYLYNAAFLLNGGVEAALPFTLLIVLFDPGLARRGAALALGVVVALVGAAVALGAVREWAALMSATQAIALVGVVGYLLFCGAYLLGHLPRADAYLAGYVAISALFTVLLPIQEVFFRSFGRDAAGQLWSLNQLLHIFTLGVQIAIVGALLYSLRRTDARHAAPAMATWRSKRTVA
jgi:hypothetical protein